MRFAALAIAIVVLIFLAGIAVTMSGASCGC